MKHFAQQVGKSLLTLAVSLGLLPSSLSLRKKFMGPTCGSCQRHMLEIMSRFVLFIITNYDFTIPVYDFLEITGHS